MWVGVGVAMLCVIGCERQVKQTVERAVTEAAGFRLACSNGVQVTLRESKAADAGRPAAKLTFDKRGTERRMLALDAKVGGKADGAKALIIRYRGGFAGAVRPRLAAVFFEENGGAWYKIGPECEAGEQFRDGRVAMGALTEAEFSATKRVAEVRRGGAASAATGPDWGKIRRVWVGVVIDEASKGTLEISGARFTAESYKPTGPLKIPADSAGSWTPGQDKAVKSALTIAHDGPGGRACMKLEFTFPGQRHMYVTPSVRVPAAELEGYTAFRLTYRAMLPNGLKGLLVTLGEREGGQHYIDPPPPPSTEWRTVTVALSDFKQAAWAKDDDGRLTLGQVDRVMIGTHGVATGAGGAGVICVSEIEFVP